MFFGVHVYTKSRSLPSRLLQCSKPRPHSPPNFRAQTINNSYFTTILCNRFQHTIIPTIAQTADDVQDPKSFPVGPSIKPEKSPINSSSDADEIDQANRLQQQPGLENIKPSEEEPITTTADKWRKAFAERARGHKERKTRWNDLLKDRGRTSYDWRIPLGLLKKHSPPQKDGPETPPGPRLGCIRKRKKLRQLHVDQIEQPSVWSILKFRNYIEDLISSRVDILIQRQLYAKGDSHKAAVGRRLVKVLKDPSKKEFLSPEAFNLAISFFFRINTLPSAINLFEYMEWLRMEISTEMVDIMLRGAASCNDLHNFTHLLRMFIRRGVLPTASTWASLIMAVQSRRARAVILKGMLERELLEGFSNMRDIVRIVVRDEIIKHLDSKLDIASFLTYMDSQFGTEWLSGSAGNIILYEIGQRRPILEAVSALDTLKERGMVADEVTLNTLLGMCKRERDHLLAIEVLRKLQVEHQVRPAELTYKILFMQAWRSRLYNFTTVIWRSACIEGAATFQIRNLVRKNLQRAACTSEYRPESRARIWSISAGEVIVGINQPDDIDRILFPSSGSKTMRRARASIIADDLAAAGRYRLVDDLTALLLKALQLDRGWMKTGAWKTQSARWKRENALPVLVKKIEPKPLERLTAGNIKTLLPEPDGQIT